MNEQHPVRRWQKIYIYIYIVRETDHLDRGITRVQDVSRDKHSKVDLGEE